MNTITTAFNLARTENNKQYKSTGSANFYKYLQAYMKHMATDKRYKLQVAAASIDGCGDYISAIVYYRGIKHYISYDHSRGIYIEE